MILPHDVIGPGFAAEVRGLDLAEVLDDATREDLVSLLTAHAVLVFRDQSLDETALLAFTRPFGQPFVHVRSQFHSATHPEVMVLTNAVPYDATRGAVGDNSELAWHSDQAYTATPVWGTALHALALPEEGGDTWFANLARACAAMPADLRRRAEGSATRFSIHGASATMHQQVTEEQSRRSRDAVHPLLRAHPLDGHAVLYLSPAHAVGVEGLGDEEGGALLGDLAAWAARPEFVYVHRWRAGDVVLWDNTQTMHRRDPFPAGQIRTLIRTGFYLPADPGVTAA